MNNEIKYREAYNQGQPILPDDVYDDMFGTTETTLDDNSGAGTLVPHLHPMLSLPTFFEDVENLTIERLRELGFPSDKFLSKDSYIGTVSYKLDGVAISVIYDADKHELQRLVSRGKRTAGFVLNKAWNSVFPAILPDAILTESIYDFRGELVISKADFERINAALPTKYANARSMIAANVNALQPNLEVVKAAKLFMHGIWTEASNRLMHFWQLDHIFADKDIAFHCYLPPDSDDLCLDIIKNMYKQAMNDAYPCDGIVLQTTVTNANNGRANLDRIAIKQMDEAKYSAETSVKNIAWRLANDGHYFPHIEFETVEINGADVNHAAGYCYDYLKRMDISIGSKVIVTMRGGVIPKVTKVLAAGTGNLNLPKDIAPIEPNDINIWSTNSHTAIERLKFIRGMVMLALENCGTELYADMYDAGYHTLFDVAKDVKSGVFWFKMVDRVVPDTPAAIAKVQTIIDRFKTFNYVWLILALRFNGVGFKAADFIGQYISGYELVDYSMLNHKAIKAVLDDTQSIELIKLYANKVAPEHATLAVQNAKPASNKPKVILSKKPSNGMTKAQFIETFLQDYDVTENIREADLLVCPAGETSNKINYAKANNTTIKFYTDFV